MFQLAMELELLVGTTASCTSVRGSEDTLGIGELLPVLLGKAS